MNQEIKPLTAVLVILAAAFLLGLVFWARGESVQVGGPDKLRLAPDGGVYLHVAGTLYRLSPSLELTAGYELTDLGVQDLVGDFAFFSDGEILLRRGRYHPTLLQSISRFLRRPSGKPPVATQADEGLYRCRLETGQCRPFGRQIDFDGAFHLSIDPATDTVFVSDTERHVLRKYDGEGNELAVSGKDYAFPNQNLLYEGGLLVADTNHHAVQFAATGTEHFGRIQASHSIRDPSLQDDIWPYSLARVGDRWWVNNMDRSMSNGAVAIYDREWLFSGRLPLPADADPIDLAVLRDRVLITDLANIRIYQADLRGALLGDALPDVIEGRLAALRQSAQEYRRLSVAAIALFVLFIAAGFVVAFVRMFQQKEPASRGVIVNIRDPNIRWIGVNRRKMRALKVVMALPVVLIALMVPLALKAGAKNLGSLAVPALLAVLAVFFIPRAFSRRLGVLGDILVIRKSDKVYAAGRGSDIVYSDTHLFVGGVYIPFSQQRLLFDTQQVVKEVMPLLRDATYIKQGQMINMVLRRQKPVVLVLIVLAVLALVALAMLAEYL